MVSFRTSAGVAASIVGIAVVPAVVGQATSPIASTQPSPAQPASESAPEKPKPAEAALTIDLNGSEQRGDAARVRIRTKGDAPPDPGTLTDVAGLEPVSVTAVDPASCADLPLHQALSQGADTEWCLELDGVKGGRTAQGAITATETVLELTVNARDGVLWPCLVGILGLALGALPLLIPAWLKNRIRTKLLDQALDDNEAETEAREIKG